MTGPEEVSIADNRENIYDASFIFCYLANIFLMISVSLLFRYADFIRLAAVDKSTYELTLGVVIGIGSVGAIVFRLVQAVAIDRFGSGWVWLVSLVGVIVSLVWHAQIESVNSIEVNLARLLYATSVAGVFGAWISFVTLRVADWRITEAIGVVGTSGFLGMALGPTIGDLIYSSDEIGWAQVQNMFYVAAAAAGFAFLCAAMAISLGGRLKNRHHHLSNAKPIAKLNKRRMSMLLLVGAILGLTINLPGTFLRPFTESINIKSIMLFFWTYNLVAFVTRITFRRAGEGMGVDNMIKIGLSAQIVSMLLYLLVHDSVTLLLPAIAGGFAHAFLFPAVIASGAAQFSASRRGWATNLTLATYDIGVLIGSPLIGLILTRSRAMGFAEYPTMFVCIAGIVLLTLTGFVLMLRGTAGDGAKELS